MSYSNISSIFPSEKNDVVLVNFIIIRGSGGMLPQEDYFNISTSETVSGGF